MNIFQLLIKSLSKFAEEDVFTYSASIAFYTVLALPSVVLILVAVGGSLYHENIVQVELDYQIHRLIGYSLTNQIETMLTEASLDQQSSWWAKLIGIVTLAVSASSVFSALQLSLNRIWRVDAEPRGGWIRFVVKRVLSFAMVIGLGFILIVSLAVETAMGLFRRYLEGYSESLSLALIEIVPHIISFGISILIFVLLFKVLPDVTLGWKDVWLGGMITTILFTGGKELIGLYLGSSSLTTLYGASGSVVVLLIWTYYAALIFLFGAKVTFIRAQEKSAKTLGQSVETLEISQNIS